MYFVLCIDQSTGENTNDIYKIHMGKTHLGPIMKAHMGHMLSQKGPKWVPYLNPCGAHVKVI